MNMVSSLYSFVASFSIRNECFGGIMFVLTSTLILGAAWCIIWSDTLNSCWLINVLV